jgi:hypothetical protein
MGGLRRRRNTKQQTRCKHHTNRDKKRNANARQEVLAFDAAEADGRGEGEDEQEMGAFDYANDNVRRETLGRRRGEESHRHSVASRQAIGIRQ